MTDITFQGGSGQLYHSAVSICLKMDRTAPALEPNQNTALGVLILSAASIEGFLNELGNLIASDPDGAPYRPLALNQFGESWRVAEHCRATTEFKYQLAKEALNSGDLEKGKEPWQSFVDLFAVRSGLVHLKPGSGTIDHEKHLVVDKSKIFKRLQKRKIVQAYSDRMNTHWISLIQTKAAAQWACDVASTVVRELIDLVPTHKEGIIDNTSWRMTNLQPAWLAFAPISEIKKEVQ
jgi:hypothetical protein